jgi:hypothetical protein
MEEKRGTQTPGRALSFWGLGTDNKHFNIVYKFKVAGALSMMSTTPFPNGMNFDQETTRSVAIEMVCATLRTGDCDDDVKEAIAKKVHRACQGR